jgi:hypothetical protein
MSLNFSDVASQSCIHKVLLHAVKFCDMGPVTSHPKEGVLRIFIAIKNLSPWLGLGPCPLGTVAGTLTTTQPRPLPVSYYFLSHGSNICSSIFQIATSARRSTCYVSDKQWLCMQLAQHCLPQLGQVAGGNSNLR